MEDVSITYFILCFLFLLGSLNTAAQSSGKQWENPQRPSPKGRAKAS